MSANTYQVKVNAAGGLHLRAAPNTIDGAILETLPNGTLLEVFIQPPNLAQSINWLHVTAPDGKTGYVAAQYTVHVTAPPVNAGNKIGLHYVPYGGIKAADFLALLDRLHNAGHSVASVTIVNDAATANKATQFVPYVIYRGEVGASDPSPVLPATAAGAYQVGVQWIANYKQAFSETNAQVYVQPATNEWDWHALDYAFWQGCMDAATALGRKIAIFADSTGTPEPAQWQTRIPALTQAAAQGHVVALHVYGPVSPPNSPVSVQNADYQYYGGRPERLYAAVPKTAWPTLIISECGTNNALFQGVDATLADMKGFNAELLASGLPIGGVNWWTCGGGAGWDKSSIDAALPAYEAWMSQTTPPPPPPPNPIADRTLIPDFSHWNDNPSRALDFGAMRKSGILAVILKASEGTAIVDASYAKFAAEAKAAGLLVASYHFLVGGNSAAQQAAHYLSVAGGGNHVRIVDLEDNPSGPSATAEDCEEFVKYIQAHTGSWPVIYSRTGVLQKLMGRGNWPGMTACPLWIAAWGAAPSIPPAWSKWAIWQYTDGNYGPEPHSVPGGDATNDLSQFSGSPAELIAFFGN